MSLPTFLVGITGGGVQDGQVPPPGANTSVEDALDLSMGMPSITSNVSEYHSYLVDARNAVRQRCEATKCWLYPYDGRSPPPCTALPLGPAPPPLVRRRNEPILSDEEDRDFWQLMNTAAEEAGDKSPCQEALDLSSPDTTLALTSTSTPAKTEEQNDDAIQTLGE